MVNYSLIEKANILLNIILSNALYIIGAVVGVILLIAILTNINKNKKINKKVYILGFSFVIAFMVIIGGKSLLGLADNFIEEFIMAVYFPNFAIYTLIILITNIAVIYSIVKDKISLASKTTNIICSVLIDLLFILTVSVIAKENISIYETLTIYSNKNLMILLETSSAVFTLWALITIGIYLVNKTVKVSETVTIENVKEVINNTIVVTKKPVVAMPSNKYRTTLNETIRNNSVVIEPVNNVMAIGENLYNKFNKGEKLNANEFEILRNYLAVKQGA